MISIDAHLFIIILIMCIYRINLGYKLMIGMRFLRIIKCMSCFVMLGQLCEAKVKK